MSSPLRRTLTALTLAAATSLTGCGPPKTVDQLIAALRDPSPGKRESAAKGLQTKQGVPVQAIPHLLRAAETEQDKDALGVMLMTLGKSGIPEAKPLIDRHIPTPDKDLRPRVGRALQYWYIANGQIAPDADLPKHWPYGQKGYPPLLEDQD